ncbi:MAG: hypothetical protein IT160_04890 [Bryobacterales bacterium]|nr:hypothetical protein [Bryobacterales bacterium]
MGRMGRVGLVVLAAVAGGVAGAGVLYESGVRPAWLERFYYGWVISSDGLAGRAYERVLAGDGRGGMELFRLAVERDAGSPYRWCDYGEALLAAGDRAGAEKAMRRGIRLGPYVGPVLMRGVNFAYRTNDAAGALEYGRRLLAITPAYDDAVFTVWERMELAAGTVLKGGIPGRRAAEAYLRRQTGAGAVNGARAAWAWIRDQKLAGDGLADEYCGFLLRAGEVEEAAGAWADWVRGREADYPAGNAVFNGGFERESAGTVFDWRLDAVEGARAERDGEVAAEGRFSLRVTFDGTRNVAYRHVTQRVAVTPGTWWFEARVRTEGITTEEGVGFRIFDAEAPGRVDVHTEGMTGTHEWTVVRARIEAPAGTRVLEVDLVRKASWKFDNKVGGRVWVDGVRVNKSRVKS